MNICLCFNLSSTGVAYLLLFVSMVFLTYRFFQYQQKNRDTTSKCLYYFVVSLSFLALVRAVTGLFFLQNIKILGISTILVSFLEGLMAAIVAYLVIHLKLPKVSPWSGFAVFFVLGLLVSFQNYVFLLQTKITVDSWGALIVVPALPFSAILQSIVLFFSFLALIFILLQQFSAAKEKYLKIRALGLSIVLFLGIIFGSLDLFIIELFKFGGIVRDIIMAVLSVILFFVIFLTQKPPAVEEK